MPRKFSEGINPHTGKYFYREHKKTVRQSEPEQFDNTVSFHEQIGDRLPIETRRRFEASREAFNVLEHNGFLPDRRGRATWRHIVTRLNSAISRHNKQQKQHATHQAHQ